MENTSFDLMIIGTGKIGLALADRIAKKEWSAGNKISNCYIISRNPDKANVAAERANSITEHTYFIPGTTDYIEGIDAKIAIVCADANLVKSLDRNQLTNGNLNMIAELVPKLTKKQRAVGIVSNNATTLPPIAAFYQYEKNFSPEYIFGIIHGDTIRARGKIREIFRQETGRILPLESLDSLFVIGGHDTGEMIPAFCSAKIGEVDIDLIHFLKHKYGEVRAAVEESGKKQMDVLGNTNADTIEAITKTIDAIMDEKTVVSAAAYCDFNSPYFKLDRNFELLAGEFLPSNPVYQCLPVKFKDFKTEFHDLNWFKDLALPIKKEFYEIAERHAWRVHELLKLIEQKPKRKSIKKPEIEEIRRTNESLEVKKAESADVLVAAGNSILFFEKDSKSVREAQFRHPIKKIGIIDNGYYATFAKGFYTIDKELSETRCFVYGSDGGDGLNKVIKSGQIYLASDSKLGVLKSAGSSLVQVVEDSARAVTEYNNEIIFINKNRVINLYGTELFRNKRELVDIFINNGLLIVPDVSGNIYFQREPSKWDRVSLGAKIYSASIFEIGNKKHVALGTDSGLKFINEETIGTTHLFIDKKVKVVAGGKNVLFFAEPETYLKSWPEGITYNLKEKIMSICPIS